MKSSYGQESVTGKYTLHLLSEQVEILAMVCTTIAIYTYVNHHDVIYNLIAHLRSNRRCSRCSITITFRSLISPPTKIDYSHICVYIIIKLGHISGFLK